jgi:hypothetical protein
MSVELSGVMPRRSQTTRQSEVEPSERKRARASRSSFTSLAAVVRSPKPAR